MKKTPIRKMPVTRVLRPPRPFYLAVMLFCGGLLGVGYYLQFAAGLEPCPLCIFQRIAYVAILAIALLGAIHAPAGRWRGIYDGVLAGAAAAGAAIAGRQVWMQHLPPGQVPECGPGLDYMLEVFPIAETLRMVLSGSGECAEVDWTFLSLSIAEWSLLCFLVLSAAALAHAIRGRGQT